MGVVLNFTCVSGPISFRIRIYSSVNQHFLIATLQAVHASCARFFS